MGCFCLIVDLNCGIYFVLCFRCCQEFCGLRSVNLGVGFVRIFGILLLLILWVYGLLNFCGFGRLGIGFGLGCLSLGSLLNLGGVFCSFYLFLYVCGSWGLRVVVCGYLVSSFAFAVGY